MNKNKTIHRDRNLKTSGFSLIEMLVTLAIMGIVGLAFSQMIVALGKTLQSFSNRSTALETSGILRSTFASLDYCNCFFKNNTFKESTMTWNTPITKVPNAFVSNPSPCTATTDLIPTVGGLVPGTQIRVEAISFEGTLLRAPGSYRSRLNIQVSNPLGAIKNINTAVQFKISTTTGDEDNRPFISCDPLDTNLVSSASEVIAVHSQTNLVPSCPANWTQLWTGYSYGGASGGHGYIAGNSDLGRAGSCLSHFRPTTFVECGDDGVDQGHRRCDFFTGGDYSSWLINRTYLNTGVMDFATSKTFVSRCSVCAGQGPVFAFHSQTVTVPDCPSGSTSLWTGYSYSGGGLGDSVEPGASADLASPGSCLARFTPIPFMECGGGSGSQKCDIYTGKDFSFWLSSNTTSTDELPEYDDVNIISKVSRCRVCAFR